VRVVVAGAAAAVWGFHGPAIAEAGVEVVGVYDPNHTAAERVAAELGCPAVADLDALFALDADAAVVLAPHPRHAGVASACLRAGLHVLCEKPLTVRVSEADALVAEADRCDRLLAVAFQQRTRSEVVEARRLVATGTLGRLQRIDLVASWPRRSSYFATAPWRGSWAGEGGGVLVNQGPHDLDLLCLLAGLPARVTAVTRTVFQPIETEDTVAALLEWEDGALGTVHLSTVEADEEQRLELTGTQGRLRLLPGRLDVWRNDEDMRDWLGGDGDPYEPPQVNGPSGFRGEAGSHAALYRNLAAAIAGAEPLVAPAASAARSVELANALILSGATRESVQLPVDRNAYDALLAELAGAVRGS
jgi:predicted dehydrogenase